MDGNFRVEGQPLDGGVEGVSVFGELDQATAPELRRVLDQAVAKEGPVCVDLSECDFIDSTGLSLLLETQRRLADLRRGFAVCSARAEVRKLLELTGIDAAVSLFETRDEALSTLGSAGV